MKGLDKLKLRERLKIRRKKKFKKRLKPIKKLPILEIEITELEIKQFLRTKSGIKLWQL